MAAWPALQAILASIVLRFDGSWKQPRDPEFPTSSLGRMAACAACILIPKEQPDGPLVEHTVALVGGRRLDVGVGLVRGSAEAEYEGILLGLDGLLQLYDDSDVHGIFHSSSAAATFTTITIEGDCKTVIDQLQGSSRPRKLDHYYNRAIDLIQQLPFEFRYQHIPRAENVLCDRICARILEEQQLEAWESAHEELSLIYMNDAFEGEDNSSEDLLSSFLHRHFGPGKNFIPLSRRPPLYRSIASTASRIRDFAAIVQVGSMLETEVKTAWTNVRTSSVSSMAMPKNETADLPVSLDQRFKDKLLIDAVVYQAWGLQNLGKEKKEAIVKRKHRYLLEKYSDYATTVEVALNGEAPFAALLPGSEGAAIASKSSRSGEDEWPPLVTHWYDEASLSNSWRDESMFWTSSNLPTHASSIV
jgi:hypothetical protein